MATQQTAPQPSSFTHLNDTVQDLLNAKGSVVWSVAPQDCVYYAIEIMAEKYVGALLVIAHGKLVGVMSERDYARKVILQGKSSKDTPVEAIMSSPVIYVAPGDTVRECMRIVTENRIRHLPVVENDKVLGMISIGDLVKWVISAQEQTINHLQDYIQNKYPG